jgi:AraC-like DNA-binding protein
MDEVRIAPNSSERVHRCPGRSGPLSAELRAGWITTGAPVDQQMSTPQFALCWVLAGKGEAEDDRGDRWHLEPGVAFHRFPGRRLRMRFDTPAQWCFIALPAGMHAALLRLSPGAAQPFVRARPDASILRRWRQATRFLRRCHDADLPAAAADLLGLVAAVHRRAAGARCDPWIERACRLLAGDPAAGMPLDAVARELGLSPSGFRARFTAAVGLAPRAWQQRQRMAHAQELLGLPGTSVANVAAAMGYADAAAFARAFRTAVGLSPGAWRRQAG